jgi:hypothetical protein
VPVGWTTVNSFIAPFSVRQPLFDSSIGRWRPYAAMFRPLLDELGMQDARIRSRGASPLTTVRV